MSAGRQLIKESAAGLASVDSICSAPRMPHTLVAKQIRRTREAFRLSSSQFATVLGVHPTTVSRWENARSPVVVDGMAYTVLTALRRRLEASRRAPAAAQKQGEEISNALVFGGTVLALALLVSFAAERE